MSDHCQICGQTCPPERAVTLDYLGEPVQACMQCARTRMSSLNQQMRALRKERKAIGRQIGAIRQPDIQFEEEEEVLGMKIYGFKQQLRGKVILVRNQAQMDCALDELKYDGEPIGFIPGKASAACHQIETTRNTRPRCIVAVRDHPDRNQIAALLAHEAVHCFYFFAEALPVKWLLDDEFVATAIQTITFSLLEQFDASGPKEAGQ